METFLCIKHTSIPTRPFRAMPSAWKYNAIYEIILILLLSKRKIRIRAFTTLLKSIRTLATRHPHSLLYSVRSAFAFGSFLGLWGCLAFRMKEAPFFVGSDVVGMLGICGIAGALTASNVGKYVPRWGVEFTNTIGILLQTLAWMILAILNDSYIGLVTSIIIIDIGMQCIQLSNQSATMKLCPEASSRMNTIYMVTYFIGGSAGTFLAGTLWSLFGWAGTVTSGMFSWLVQYCLSL